MKMIELDHDEEGTEILGAFQEECILLILQEDLDRLPEAMESGAGVGDAKDKVKETLGKLREEFAGDPPLSLFAEKALRRIEEDHSPDPQFLEECSQKADQLIGYIYELKDGMAKDELDELLSFSDGG